MGLAIAAAITSIAWLFQKAWERQERRIERYLIVMDKLPSFTERQLSPDGLDEAIAQLRRLWLSAPDDVVRAGEKFLDAVEGIPRPGQKVLDSELELANYILMMRRDASLKSAILPRFWRTTLQEKEFRLRNARRPHSN